MVKEKMTKVGCNGVPFKIYNINITLKRRIYKYTKS